MSGKDTVFYPKKSINLKGNLLSLEIPVVMGILNVTPDSFYPDSRATAMDSVLKKAEEHLKNGAAIIDIGGYSSRPGADHISEEKEIDRLLPAIEAITDNFPEAIISVDTFRSRIAKEAIAAGAAMINDISGGELDNKMFSAVIELNVPYVLMHMKGTPQNMQENIHYSDLLKEINLYFAEKVTYLRSEGVKDIIIDPGFGFSKTLEENYLLLEHLPSLNYLNLPVLGGVSRKSMINKVAGTKPEKAGNATTALHMLLLSKGVKILRVHDVKEAVEAIKIFTFASHNK